MLLVPDALDLEGLAALYAAVDCVVPHGDPLQAARAHKVEKSILANLFPATWRRATEQPLGGKV
ncbi:hypothetical protein D3C72_2446420 [compost metagenome]